MIPGFDVVISTPHPACVEGVCLGIQCVVWSLLSTMPGAPLDPNGPLAATCTIHTAECTEEGPIATFHIEPNPGADIIGYCVSQLFEDGTASECATGSSPPGGPSPPPPIHREIPWKQKTSWIATTI